jgi:hypothetical protein
LQWRVEIWVENSKPGTKKRALGSILSARFLYMASPTGFEPVLPA